MNHAGNMVLVNFFFFSLQIKYKISTKLLTLLLKENKKKNTSFNQTFTELLLERPLFNILINNDPNANGELLLYVASSLTKVGKAVEGSGLGSDMKI